MDYTTIYKRIVYYGLIDRSKTSREYIYGYNVHILSREVVLELALEVALLQHVDHAEHAVHRGANLVAHGGEEV